MQNNKSDQFTFNPQNQFETYTPSAGKPLIFQEKTHDLDSITPSNCQDINAPQPVSYSSNTAPLNYNPQGDQPPYNTVQGYNYSQNCVLAKNSSGSIPGKCGDKSLLLMSFLLFLIIITDIILFSIDNDDYSIVYIIVNDILILICAIFIFVIFYIFQP